MKVKQLFLGIATAALGIVAGIFGFLNMFDYKTITTIGDNTSEWFAKKPWGIFGGEVNKGLTAALDLADKDYSGAFRTIAMILVIVLLVAVVAYVALVVIDFKKGSKFSTLRKILAIVMATLGVLLAVSLLVYVLGNSGTISTVLGESPKTHKLYCSSVFGAIALTVFPVLAGVAGYMAECGAKAKKSSKKKK